MIITIDTEKANLTAEQIKQIHEIIIGSPLTDYCTCPTPQPCFISDTKCWNCKKPISPKEYCKCMTVNQQLINDVWYCRKCKLPTRPKSPPIELLRIRASEEFDKWLSPLVKKINEIIGRIKGEKE